MHYLAYNTMNSNMMTVCCQTRKYLYVTCGGKKTAKINLISRWNSTDFHRRLCLCLMCPWPLTFWSENLNSMPLSSNFGELAPIVTKILYSPGSSGHCLLWPWPFTFWPRSLPCKMHNFFIWLKLCCIPPNVSGSESRLQVGIGGSEKNRLWCVANGMSGKRRYSKCSKWPPSALNKYMYLYVNMQIHVYM